MKLRPILVACAAFAAAALPGAAAIAQSFEPNWNSPRYQGPNEQRERAILSVREIIAAVRSQMGAGDVIGSPVLREGPRAYYIVRWRQPNGVVRDVRVNAHNGQVMG